MSLYSLLTKFNNASEKEYKTYKENFMKRFEITQLPPYLILYIKVKIEHIVLNQKCIFLINFFDWSLQYYVLEIYEEHIFHWKKSYYCQLSCKVITPIVILIYLYSILFYSMHILEMSILVIY